MTVAGSNNDPGPWSYQFSSPTAITFDQLGYMYILDAGNSRVQRWIPGAPYGFTMIQTTMSSPRGMIIDRLGHLIIADTSYHRLISFGLTCRELNKFAPMPSIFSIVLLFSCIDDHHFSTTE